MSHARRHRLRGAFAALALSALFSGVAEAAPPVTSATLDTGDPAQRRYSGPCPATIRLKGSIVTDRALAQSDGVVASFSCDAGSTFASTGRTADIRPVTANGPGTHVVAVDLVVAGAGFNPREANGDWTLQVQMVVRGPAAYRVATSLAIHVHCVATVLPSGWTRVTAKGFRVTRASQESRFETNGAGDEVKLLSQACTYATQVGGTPQLQSPVVSHTYGDTSVTARHAFTGIALTHSQVRVSTGTASGTGGLVTGSAVPGPAGYPTPPRAAGPQRLFPLVLWQGDLRAPGAAVVIVPTMWELDQSAGNVEPQPTFDSQIARNLMAQGRRLLTGASGSVSTVRSSDLRLVANVVAGEFTRPIGTAWEGDFPQAFAANPAVLVFRPVVIRLNGPSALAAASQANESESRARGDLDVKYTDGSDFGGEYVLSLHVEIGR